MSIIKNKTRFFVTVLFIFSLSGNISAQFKFNVGPKVSVNFTNVNFSKGEKTVLLPGVEAGAFFRFSISRVYIQPEVNYILKNTKFKDDWQSALHELKANFEHKAHHIGVPVLVGVHVVNNKNFKLRLFAGPEFNFKLGDNIAGEKLWNNFQYGLQAGVGVDIWRFTVDVGYTYLACKNLDELRSNIKYSNENAFKVGVGFKFLK